MKTAAAAAALSFLIIAYAMVSNEGYSDAVQARSLYCEMVQAWHASNGEFGWPPFEGECE